LVLAAGALLVFLVAGPSAPASQAAPPRPVTIEWVGDTVLGSSFGLPPDDGR
jgi:hypothetical protein